MAHLGCCPALNFLEHLGCALHTCCHLARLLSMNASIGIGSVKYKRGKVGWTRQVEVLPVDVESSKRYIALLLISLRIREHRIMAGVLEYDDGPLVWVSYHY